MSWASLHYRSSTNPPPIRYQSATDPLLPLRNFRYATTATPLPLRHYRYATTATLLPLHYYRYATTATLLPLRYYRYAITATLLIYLTIAKPDAANCWVIVNAIKKLVTIRFI